MTMQNLECNPSIPLSRSQSTGSIRRWISSELAVFLQSRTRDEEMRERDTHTHHEEQQKGDMRGGTSMPAMEEIRATRGW
jgi:hypothetical protein